MKNIAVIGSRNFNDYELLCKELNKHKIETIISGGARGADQLAANFAKEHKIQLIEHLPDYAKYGRRAPLVRNEFIVRDADQVIAFWDGKSRGTAYTIKLAENAGKKVAIIKY